MKASLKTIKWLCWLSRLSIHPYTLFYALKKYLRSIHSRDSQDSQITTPLMWLLLLIVISPTLLCVPVAVNSSPSKDKVIAEMKRLANNNVCVGCYFWDLRVALGCSNEWLDDFVSEGFVNGDLTNASEHNKITWVE